MNHGINRIRLEKEIKFSCPSCTTDDITDRLTDGQTEKNINGPKNKQGTSHSANRPTGTCVSGLALGQSV